MRRALVVLLLVAFLAVLGFSSRSPELPASPFPVFASDEGTPYYLGNETVVHANKTGTFPADVNTSNNAYVNYTEVHADITVNVTMRPSGNGTYSGGVGFHGWYVTQSTIDGCQPPQISEWACVDEDSPDLTNNGGAIEAKFGLGSAVGRKESFIMENVSSLIGPGFDSLAVVWYARCSVQINTSVKMSHLLILGGVEDVGTDDIDTCGQKTCCGYNFSNGWYTATTRPGGGAWNLTNLDDLECGASGGSALTDGDNGANNFIHTLYCYAVATYSTNTLEVQHDWSAVGGTATRSLVIEAYHDSNESFYVQVWDWVNKIWHTRLTIMATTDADTNQSYVLKSAELNATCSSPSCVRVRYIDPLVGSDVDPGSLLIDQVYVFASGIPGQCAGGNGQCYWIGGSGSWSSGSHWSKTSGGSACSCVPFDTDNAYLNDTGTVTLDVAEVNISSLYVRMTFNTGGNSINSTWLLVVGTGGIMNALSSTVFIRSMDTIAGTFNAGTSTIAVDFTTGDIATISIPIRIDEDVNNFTVLSSAGVFGQNRGAIVERTLNLTSLVMKPGTDAQFVGSVTFHGNSTFDASPISTAAWFGNQGLNSFDASVVTNFVNGSTVIFSLGCGGSGYGDDMFFKSTPTQRWGFVIADGRCNVTMQSDLVVDHTVTMKDGGVLRLGSYNLTLTSGYIQLWDQVRSSGLDRGSALIANASTISVANSLIFSSGPFSNQVEFHGTTVRAAQLYLPWTECTCLNATFIINNSVMFPTLDPLVVTANNIGNLTLAGTAEKWLGWVDSSGPGFGVFPHIASVNMSSLAIIGNQNVTVRKGFTWNYLGSTIGSKLNNYTLRLRSNETGSPWTFRATNALIKAYRVNVSDSFSTAIIIDATNTTNINSGGNTGWCFSALSVCHIDHTLDPTNSMVSLVTGLLVGLIPVVVLLGVSGLGLIMVTRFRQRESGEFRALTRRKGGMG